MQFTASTHKNTFKSGISFSGLVVVLLLSTFLQIASSAHLQRHAQPSTDKQYDSAVYFNELNGIQTKLNNDLNNIKDQFTMINLQLNNTNISSSAQVIYLQQNLANERDALFNIQNYLNVPFALRSCQCVNLTQPQKDSLKNQIQNVSQAIQNLSNSVKMDSNGKQYQSPKCEGQNCASVRSINNQVTQMKKYVQIMNDTVTSECCKIINYVYRDNLVDSVNWVYGNLTDEQYRLSVFQRSQNVNLTQCPKAKPFVNLKTNQCFACDTNLVFNLETRACQPSCESSGLILNQQTHNCDYNRTCPTNQHFSEILHQCLINLGTASNCPSDRPIWNEAILSCQKCVASQPYYDPIVQACRPCTANQNWDSVGQACVSKITGSATSPQDIDLPKPIQYNPGTSGRVGTTLPSNPSTSGNPSNPSTKPDQTTPPSPVLPPSPGNVNSGTFSNCPPDSPFWNSQIFACSKCPQTTPFFNSKTTTCQNCPKNTIWNPTSNTCGSSTATTTVTSDCLSNQIYNTATGKCDNISPTGQIGLCPPSTPFWNAKTLACNKCNATNPLWNDALQQCTTCPSDTAWDINYNLCQSTLVQCPSGQVLNKTTGKCSSVVCPADKPIYNTKTSQCQSCPVGTTLNKATLICQSNSNERAATSVCPGDTPYWNANQLVCQVCPNGLQWNASSRQCLASNVHQLSQKVGLFVHESSLTTSRVRHQLSSSNEVNL